MRLYLKNIGKVVEASIEIKGITIIAGENNTGKSTVGRALFSVFNCFYEINKQIRQERIYSIANTLEPIFRISRSINKIYNIYECAREILNKSEEYKGNKELLTNDLKLMLDKQSDIVITYYIDDITNRILDILNVTDSDIFQSFINKKIDSEFHGQILNIYSEDCGIISLEIKDKKLEINISKDTVFVNDTQFCLHTEAIYIDDPFILDDMDLRLLYRKQNYFDHRMHLEKKLSLCENNSSVVEKIVVEKKLNEIYEKMSSICGGNIIRQKDNRLVYKINDSDKTLNIKNLSTGLKTFVILKTLLINGLVKNNGTIILDEPEIHLHPEWQLLFAELIVLLHKKFNMHILLNTHSPYFLRAIQVYSAKYEISDMCKYYLSEVKENGKVYIDDVTDNINKIYAKLSKPLQDLEDERWNFD